MVMSFKLARRNEAHGSQARVLDREQKGGAGGASSDHNLHSLSVDLAGVMGTEDMADTHSEKLGLGRPRDLMETHPAAGKLCMLITAAG